MAQKFFAGDYVYVKHNQHAIVLHSYAEHHGNNNTRDLGLYLLEDKRTQSWFNETQLMFIEPNRFDLLPTNNIIRMNYEAKLERDEGNKND